MSSAGLARNDGHVETVHRPRLNVGAILLLVMLAVGIFLAAFAVGRLSRPVSARPEVAVTNLPVVPVASAIPSELSAAPPINVGVAPVVHRASPAATTPAQSSQQTTTVPVLAPAPVASSPQVAPRAPARPAPSTPAPHSSSGGEGAGQHFSSSGSKSGGGSGSGTGSGFDTSG